MILAGDIGGTNTRLALVDATPAGLRIEVEETFSSRERTSLEAAVEDFLALHPCDLTRAAFGIAGPVRDGRCEATNLPWMVDSRILARLLHIKRVGLMNDLVANSHGIAVLKS
ncbi:MAG: glucokinase, partial [Syntrophobacteraceae bacterium]|nr:glucokinase [Syntrophobacteraceae bacterium]